MQMNYFVKFNIKYQASMTRVEIDDVIKKISEATKGYAHFNIEMVPVGVLKENSQSSRSE